ncbi:hypothetical protein ACIQWA_02925 [Kitasatospora sp. NPDC098652]|uniref:hypothetical protein n=1 Tax=Kitasatospora sp. NPDC098652 TaxID=3364095 RepID=UPI0038166853
MTDLEFERRMNPWLFDDRGNLTEAAKKQFPDLVGANNAPVTLGGRTVKANPGMLQQAAQNAFALRDAVKTELSQPGEHVNAAAASLKGWSLGAGLTGLWMTWSTQAESLRGTVEDIGNKLQGTGQAYAQTEADIHAGFQQGAKA